MVLSLSKLLLSQLKKGEGRAHEYFSTPDFCGRTVANAFASLQQPQACQPDRPDLVAGRHAVRRVLAGVDFVGDDSPGPGRPERWRCSRDDAAPNEVGGISNAIFGSVVMVLLATFVGTPIGIMAGVYLAEYESRSWLAATTRFVNDILLSAPQHRDRSVRLRRGGARFKSFSATQAFWRWR